MKKLNLFLSAIALCSCAQSIISMESDAVIYGKKVGITGIRPDMPRPNLRIQGQQMRDAFLEKYGMTAQKLVNAIILEGAMIKKYIDYAKQERSQRSNRYDNADPVVRRSKIANRVIRKYVKSGDIYCGVPYKNQRAHYNQFKTHITKVVAPALGLKMSYINFPNYGHYRHNVAITKCEPCMPRKHYRKSSEAITTKGKMEERKEVKSFDNKGMKKRSETIVKEAPKRPATKAMPGKMMPKRQLPVKTMPVIEPRMEMLVQNNDEPETNVNLPEPKPMPGVQPVIGTVKPAPQAQMPGVQTDKGVFQPAPQKPQMPFAQPAATPVNVPAANTLPANNIIPKPAPATAPALSPKPIIFDEKSVEIKVVAEDSKDEEASSINQDDENTLKDSNDVDEEEELEVSEEEVTQK